VESEGHRDNAVRRDLSTAEALVRLRLLTGAAERLVDDTSPAGQHQALIALDGVCEYALWLALNERGIQPKFRDGLPDLYSKFAEATGLRSPGWRVVGQMHQARNLAQHSGVAAGVKELPDWREATLAFIDAICVEVFATRLADISLADAVRDPALRQSLQGAEEQMQTAPAASLQLIRDAFSTARDSWRTQLHTRVLPLFPVSQQLEVAPSPSAGPADEFQELEPFASDLGEYLWFWRVGQELDLAGWEPSVEDARRALGFVTGWIVRWEIFVLGYPDEEWAAHRESIGPPILGDGTTVQITGAETEVLPEVPGRPPRHIIYFQLGNVPGRGRAPWDAILRDALVEHGREALAAPFQQILWSIHGILTVHVGLDADPATTANVVEMAVRSAQDRYAVVTAGSAEREQRRQELERELRKLVAATGNKELGVFGEVSVVSDQWLGTSGWIALFEVRSAGRDLLELNTANHSFVDQKVFPNLHQRGHAMAFMIAGLTDELRTALVAAIERTNGHVLYVREFRSRQEETVNKFAAGIRGRFPPIGDG
jgi:hypothetical protein